MVQDVMVDDDPRIEARRQQIIEAALDCARRSGFHAASMAEIARAAKLSVGQIYRYFANKEAIISAIVARDAADLRDRFAQFQRAGKPPLDAILEHCPLALDEKYDPRRAALVLEVMAEAARNPLVAQVIRATDAEEREIRLDLFRRIAPPGLSERELRARGEILSMVFEGMVMRGVNNPEADRAAISEVLRPILRYLLAAPAGGPVTAAGGENPSEHVPASL